MFMTERRPIMIDTQEWPLIDEMQLGTTVSVYVRRHRDGRLLVHGWRLLSFPVGRYAKHAGRIAKDINEATDVIISVAKDLILGPDDADATLILILAEHLYGRLPAEEI